MADLALRFGCGSYDRMEALWTGEAAPEGIALEVSKVDVPRQLFDQVDQGKFDAGEYGMTGIVENAAKGDKRFAAIPAFPSKMFRHGYIYVNRRSGIREPKDLAGRRIGVPSISQTAAIWIRGHLEHDYGADLSRVLWITGAADRPGPLTATIIPPKLHVPTRIEPAPPGKSLDDLLVAGEIDALLGANRAPSLGRNPDIVRLFPDYRRVERDYYRRTGIHPMMHAVVVRRDIYDANPWVAASLFRACEAAKRIALDKLRPFGASRSLLPWAEQEMDEVDELFGGDPYSYGIEPNRAALAALIDYMAEQGFIARKPAVEELFVDVEGSKR
jgi:4,5-dihydroxyphthalate decarboxylase